MLTTPHFQLPKRAQMIEEIKERRDKKRPREYRAARRRRPTDDRFGSKENEKIILEEGLRRAKNGQKYVFGATMDTSERRLPLRLSAWECTAEQETQTAREQSTAVRAPVCVSDPGLLTLRNERSSSLNSVLLLSSSLLLFLFLLGKTANYGRRFGVSAAGWELRN